MRNHLKSVALVLFSAISVSGQQADSARVIPNVIDVEPKYECDTPLFAMAIFGEQNEKPMWLVIDRSAKSEVYDRLYVDLDCDGDLTDADEAFDIAKDKSVELPDVTAQKDCRFSDVSIRFRDLEAGVGMLKAKWNDEIRFGGGYPESSKKGYMTFAADKTSAPVVYFKGQAPFEFQPWYPDPLVIGGDTDLSLFLGHRGRGPSSFCSTLGHILPKDDPILVTLHYTDANGKQQRADSKLKERC